MYKRSGGFREGAQARKDAGLELEPSVGGSQSRRKSSYNTSEVSVTQTKGQSKEVEEHKKDLSRKEYTEKRLYNSDRLEKAKERLKLIELKKQALKDVDRLMKDFEHMFLTSTPQISPRF